VVRIVTSSRQWLVLVAAIAWLAVAGYADYLTGPTVIVFPLYLLSVALVTVSFGRAAGIAAGGACTITWLVVNLSTRQVMAGEFAPYWNSCMWLLAFTIVAFLIHARRELGRKIEELVDEKTVALQAEIDERKRTEDAVHRLAAQLSEAEEMQRRQLAHDIHDTLGQTLTVIKMNLQALLHTDDMRLQRQIKDSLSMIENMIRQTRSMTFELYPAMLDDLGLVPTIRRHLEEFQSRTGLRASVSESGEHWKLPASTANYVYRAVKELINNASKHGRAYEILVTVHWRAEGLRVVVDDDGCGFEVKDVRPHQGLGLASIEERLMSLGGRSTIESQVGKGTRVILELPRVAGDPSAETVAGKSVVE
jgi:signal transduction histidine kinase